MVLGDIELFIVSWLIWISAYLVFGIQEFLIIREVKRKEYLDNASNPSIVFLVLFIILHLVGITVDLMNIIPISSYNDETALFRVFRPSFGVLAVSLISGSLCMYFKRQVPEGIKTEEGNIQTE